MADSLRIEALDITTIASVETLGTQKSLFAHIDSFYRGVAGPERLSSSPGLESWVGPLVDYVREGGSIDLDPTAARPLERFYTALVKYLAMPERNPSPLPISNVTLRIETTSSDANMQKQFSGTSPFFVSLLTQKATAEAPAQVVITGNFGKAKRVVNAAGKPCKRAEVSAWVYSRFIAGLVVGQVWLVDAPPAA